jgi:hypothetical protein
VLDLVEGLPGRRPGLLHQRVARLAHQALLLRRRRHGQAGQRAEHERAGAGEQRVLVHQLVAEVA